MTVIELVVIAWVWSSSAPVTVIKVDNFQSLENCEREAGKLKAMLTKAYRTADHTCVLKEYQDAQGPE